VKLVGVKSNVGGLYSDGLVNELLNLFMSHESLISALRLIP